MTAIYHAEPWRSSTVVYCIYDPNGNVVCRLHEDPETLLAHLNRQQIAKEKMGIRRTN